MRSMIGAFDWKSSPIGPIATWPDHLKTALGIALDTNFAMMIMWGPDFVQLYNDAYIPIFADKHPRSLGQPARECWAEIWDRVGPLLSGVFASGEPVYFENLELPVLRNARTESAYFTFSYSPLRAGDSIGGLLCVVTETTANVVRERELRAGEARFRTLAASMPHIVLEGSATGELTFLSARYESYTGRPVATGLGAGWLDAIAADDAPAARERWRASVASGEPFAAEFRLRRHDGALRWHRAEALPLRDAGGAVERWTGTIGDIHDARRAVEERDVLSDASRVLSESLDLALTLQHIAELTVPRFADWCQIDLRTADGRIETVAIAHRDPAKNALAQRFLGLVHLDPDAAHGQAYAIRTGRSDLFEDLPYETLAAAVGDAEETRLYTELGIRSFASIPLVAQGETLGAIGVVYGDSERRYAHDDLPALEELGRRAGLAVQNARDFTRQLRVAESFQEASLPLHLPVVHGLDFDAVYLPGSNEAHVGGDWYDAVRLLDGRVMISIGDVAGSGLNAAVRMGNIRQIIRGIAQVHADPALMLDAADRALRLEHPDGFVTAFVGVIDPVADSLVFASAGHPPPMLRFEDGRVVLLSDGGLPLGLRQGRGAPSGSVVDLRGATSLVLYTDGLSEATREPLSGERMLRDVLADGAVLAHPHPAHAIKDVFLDGGLARDDVAILVVTMALSRGTSTDSAPVRQWAFDVGDAAAAQRARHEFSEALRARNTSAEDLFAAEVVLGELVGNVVRYASGPIEVSVDFNAPAPVLNVLDRGPGFRHSAILPSDIFSESGRGLFLVSALTDDFHVSKRANGGSHARAVLMLSRERLVKATAP